MVHRSKFKDVLFKKSLSFFSIARFIKSAKFHKAPIVGVAITLFADTIHLQVDHPLGLVQAPPFTFILTSIYDSMVK